MKRSGRKTIKLQLGSSTAPISSSRHSSSSTDRQPRSVACSPGLDDGTTCNFRVTRIRNSGFAECHETANAQNYGKGVLVMAVLIEDDGPKSGERGATTWM
jgi:hypothetical protein